MTTPDTLNQKPEIERPEPLRGPITGHLVLGCFLWSIAILAAGYAIVNCAVIAEDHIIRWSDTLRLFSPLFAFAAVWVPPGLLFLSGGLYEMYLYRRVIRSGIRTTAHIDKIGTEYRRTGRRTKFKHDYLYYSWTDEMGYTRHGKREITDVPTWENRLQSSPIDIEIIYEASQPYHHIVHAPQ